MVKQLFIAYDGTVFATKQDCIAYEHTNEFIEVTQNQKFNLQTFITDNVNSYSHLMYEDIGQFIVDNADIIRNVLEKYPAVTPNVPKPLMWLNPTQNDTVINRDDLYV